MGSFQFLRNENFGIPFGIVHIFERGHADQPGLRQRDFVGILFVLDHAHRNIGDDDLALFDDLFDHRRYDLPVVAQGVRSLELFPQIVISEVSGGFA